MALLIDFGNVVRGVESDIDCKALFRLAGEHGRVAAANAYADWSADDVRGYRAALRGAGIEPVDVPARSDPTREVCIRMAMDAVELMWSAPQVGVYVMVAADGGAVPCGGRAPAAREEGRRRVAGGPLVVVRGKRRSDAEAQGPEPLRPRRGSAVSGVCISIHCRATRLPSRALPSAPGLAGATNRLQTLRAARGRSRD
ncbi:MAG: NYN domain-containing protein [Gammaproteobacteria bacterium]|nr:NYN domain-containing protein [Gammaproteobacteria bacterium]MDE0040028.1 NYN domain-containing protein [Gammaproteobacteria bacterium]MDE0444931.1 NYN domain-containing protein [Gammaproteobacteria bacterium]